MGLTAHCQFLTYGWYEWLVLILVLEWKGLEIIEYNNLILCIMNHGASKYSIIKLAETLLVD